MQTVALIAGGVLICWVILITGALAVVKYLEKDLKEPPQKPHDEFNVRLYKALKENNK